MVPAAELMAEARALAGRIASAPAPAIAKAKDCVLRAMEVPLAEGLRYEQCALIRRRDPSPKSLTFWTELRSEPWLHQ